MNAYVCADPKCSAKPAWRDSDGQEWCEEHRHFRAARVRATNLDDRWVIVRESVLDVGFGDDVRTGGRPELGYALLSNPRTYSNRDEAIAALQEAKLPIGWVVMPLTNLLPDIFE